MLLTLLLTLKPARADDLSMPIRALLVTGGCCHDYNAQKIILTQGISARANVTWTIVHEGGTSQNFKVSIYSNVNWAAGYDVVVHDECFPQLSDNAWVTNITAAHYAGVPAVMLHCAGLTYHSATTNNWRECLGINFDGHESQRDIVMTNVFPEHPIMRGFPTVWTNFNDELYINLFQWPNMVPLASARDPDNTSSNQVVIWANTYGAGRVFTTTLGHENTTVSNQVYLDVVTRGLLWACGRLDDITDLRLSTVQVLGTNKFIHWQSVPGWSYTVESAPGAGGPWDPVTNGTIIATNVLSTIPVADFPADQEQGFFRVRLNGIEPK